MFDLEIEEIYTSVTCIFYIGRTAVFEGLKWEWQHRKLSLIVAVTSIALVMILIGLFVGSLLSAIYREHDGVFNISNKDWLRTITCFNDGGKFELPRTGGDGYANPVPYYLDDLEPMVISECEDTEREGKYWLSISSNERLTYDLKCEVSYEIWSRVSLGQEFALRYKGKDLGCAKLVAGL